ncbi:dehydrogenase/reductase SDR family member on chromosome X-like isoform X2 [Varroa jacobsoni]|uniref:dehydrogenase/reductase SDR family member on chromosome X-like isoform X2 n=1 Tax=Varroa jacobsoni TaxID=62625 RepID=UPI000BF3605E|nr:dehydrogenase/reductase SDR family member on chromosome X-like isoform X2 [Varroa jacobsoni]
MIGLVDGPPFITVNGLRLRSVLAACWVYPAYNASPSKQSHTRSIQEIFWPLFFLEQRAKSNKTSEAGRYRQRPSVRVPREERQRTQWPSRKVQEISAATVFVAESLMDKMKNYSYLRDVFLKIYGCIVIYALAVYELVMQYVWLFRYRTGLLDAPDDSLYLRDQTLLITGGVGLIGLEVTKKATECGNFVIIFDILSQSEALKKLSALGPVNKVRYYEVDLCRLDDVKLICARLIQEKCIPNVLLFNELYPYLCPSTRVVFVSSVCHKPGFVQLDDLNGRFGYSSHLWYAQAKMCQLLLVVYLAAKTRLHVNAVHPGVVESSLYKHVLLRYILGPLCIMTGAEGAFCPTFACLSSKMRGVRGKYLEFCRPANPNRLVYDRIVQEKLFEKTAEMLKPYTDFRKLVHPQ